VPVRAIQDWHRTESKNIAKPNPCSGTLLMETRCRSAGGTAETDERQPPCVPVRFPDGFIKVKTLMSTQGVPFAKPVVFSGGPSLRGALIRRRSLCADDLIARALEKEGRTSFRNWSFIEPLRQLTHSLNQEAQLSAFGARAARFDVMRGLVNLLRLDAAEEADPEIARQPIERPIFVTGLPRSGSTFLHTLLAQDRANAVPRCWQLIYPYRSRHRVPFGDWRKTHMAVQLAMYKYLAPAVAELHPMTADGPQECSDITAQVFHSLRFDNTYHVPSYQDWISRHDHVGAYHFHRRFLRHLARQQTGRRWILKSPDHVFALDAVRAIYPDAVFVFLHRDPLPVLTSQLHLIEALRRSFSRQIDLEEIGRNVSTAIGDIVNRLVAYRARRGVLHLSYHSVVSAPLDAVRRIYAHGGLALTHEASECMTRWLARERPRRAGSHRRELTEFGLDARELRDRFARYVESFAVVPEQNRLAA